MVVPTGTVTSAGVKLKLSIFTAASILPAPAVLAARPFWLPPPLSHASRSAAVIVRDLVVIFVLLREGCSFGMPNSNQVGINHGQRMAAAQIVHVGHSKECAQLFRRHFHRPWRWGLAGLGLRECR